MRPVTVFPLRDIGCAIGRGTTRPRRATIPVVVKHDCVEWPLTVLCEIVALQIADAMAAPVVSGVLTHSPLGLSFSSLQIDPRATAFAVTRPEIARRLLSLDPVGCASLLVLDALIGNEDRLGNALGYRVPAGIRVLGFDHSHTLLQRNETPQASLMELHQLSPLRYHPFSSVPHASIVTTTDRAQVRLKEVIGDLDAWLDCFPLVQHHWGRELQDALCRRLDNLHALVRI